LGGTADRSPGPRFRIRAVGAEAGRGACQRVVGDGLQGRAVDPPVGVGDVAVCVCVLSEFVFARTMFFSRTIILILSNMYSCRIFLLAKGCLP
jgi:hypothetical protein